jgi:hypothetical protein
MQRYALEAIIVHSSEQTFTKNAAMEPIVLKDRETLLDVPQAISDQVEQTTTILI